MVRRGALARLRTEALMNCWHRPGPLSPSKQFRLCRHCGVAIQICDCDTNFRKPDPKCQVCNHSGWVAIVRGAAAKFTDYLESKQ